MATTITGKLNDNAREFQAGAYTGFGFRLGKQYYDRETKRGFLRGGDCGWDVEMEVIDGIVPDLVLNEGEARWLAACWSAVT